jgi:Zn-finger nucleic acid-binding protein
MITLELDEVEVDYCLQCSGIWLDAGELEMLLPNRHQAKMLLSSFRTTKGCSETPKPCPICLKKMEKILVGPSESAILIDKCKKGDGLWFDKGELQDVLEFGSFDEERRILDLLADMFGQKENSKTQKERTN